MTTATDGLGLLQAIIVNPDDDAVRLIYADWLEDDGQSERAEFIRLQIEFPELPDRWRQLLYAGNPPNYYLWAGWPVNDPNIFKEKEAFYKFRRGFLHTVSCPLQVWLNYGAAIVRMHPIERVVLTDRKPQETSTGKWAWAQQEGDDAPRWTLPESITAFFQHPRPDCWEWPTEEAALAAISVACIAQAKENPFMRGVAQFKSSSPVIKGV